MNTRPEHTDKKNAADAVSSFLIKNRIVLLVILAAFFAAGTGTAGYFAVSQSVREKGFTALDAIESALTEANRDETAAAAAELAAKNASNPVGGRAWLLTADIRFSQKNYEEAKSAYLAAEKANPKAYTAPVCLYNAAVCAEELGDVDGAFDLYAKAAASKNFPLASRALFNQGRLQDTKGNYAEAVQIYDDIAAKNPSDEWASLAKSRSLALRAQGKAD